ncbi:hypothetical protein CYLTODRAFT_491815 [Cylindrobasidium torrendii FP15055 ss-10]|uniref:DUF7726 domain-containing protein n=1 Tax=Cylindrobasidium torrendii FP15055 ss-10 TaxID=1314674 RepID=A0A0D7B925_9AGAR|nr:hypothetical protein CYLTODRAFT_491815 [Cylindrobasidium torrendii FP15055 ss-10]
MIRLSNGREIAPEDLPVPYILTDLKNIEYLEALEAEITAAKKAAEEGEKDNTTKPAARGSKRKRSGAAEDDDDSEREGGSKKKKSSSPKAGPSKKADSLKGADIFSIYLEGDEDGTVEIYDSCDAIRKKITIHLSNSGVTKASFLRDIARIAYPNDTPNIQSKQLTDFLSKKGATSGSTSRVFYAAYVYFEKLRLSEGKPKSAHRKKMEEEWGYQGGLPRERERQFLVPQGVVPYRNALGAVRTRRVR